MTFKNFEARLKFLREQQVVTDHETYKAPLGEVLVKEGYISSSQLKIALQLQEKSLAHYGQALSRLYSLPPLCKNPCSRNMREVFRALSALRCKSFVL